MADAAVIRLETVQKSIYVSFSLCDTQTPLQTDRLRERVHTHTHTHTEYTHFRKGSQILLSAECNKSKYIYMSAACCGHIFILTSCSAEGLNYCSHCHTIQVVHVY